MSGGPAQRPAGIAGSQLPGPFPVGAYAARLRRALRGRARVQLFGEVWNLRTGRARVYFELRDASGAVPCSMWRADWDALAGPERLADGAQVVVAGGPDYYPGSAQASPSFSFHVSAVSVAGEGDLLAQVERLRRALAAEGLLEPQKRLSRPQLPRAIGVVTGEAGKARDDVLAGLRRRGWAGRLVWAFVPVQDRHAAPQISRALQDLAACAQVEVIVVARGGGSLADLFAFCDETLCRTVALLAVPVIASVGHHTDRTLLDDVAAVSCSTPTHAAEAAVSLHCGQAREDLADCASRLARHGRAAVLDRARALARLARAPADHVERQRSRLHQHARELRAASRRRLASGRERSGIHLLVLGRKARVAWLARRQADDRLRSGAGELVRAGRAAIARRRHDLDRLSVALSAHDPDRTLARGYALVEGPHDELVTSAPAARRARRLSLRFSDGRVPARVDEDPSPG